MDWERRTVDYYDQNPDAFVEKTLTADMSKTRVRFLQHVQANGLILDFGCGSGRDTKAFMEAGYRVEATDGSEEMCVRASEYAGIPVRKMLFGELDAVNRYDGIWACASILHLPKEELLDVTRKIARALKTGGVFYTSFKYGDFGGIRGDRYYSDFMEETLRAFLANIPELHIKELWIAEDSLPEKRVLKWINVLAVKI